MIRFLDHRRKDTTMTVTEWLTTPWPYLYTLLPITAALLLTRRTDRNRRRSACQSDTTPDEYPEYPEMYR